MSPLTPEQAGIFDPHGPIFAQPVITGLNQPLFVTAPSGDHDRLFIVEKGGAIRVFRKSEERLLPTAFLTVSPLSTQSERGLLGLAFHPNHAENGRFYINFTNTAGHTVIRRYTVSADNPDRADPLSATDLLIVNQDFNNHNGGWIGFGPNDGYLYIAIGDGGSGNDPNRRALDRSNPLGSMLRIDVNDAEGGPAPTYRIPPDNPFVGIQNVREEIWAYGLRNPWRNSFDRETGDLWIADVGQSAREEINFQPADSLGGENYGWRAYEGTRFTGLEPAIPANERTDPFFEYDHSDGRKSVTGGYIYRGNALPQLHGHYFFADYVDDFVRSFLPGPDGPEPGSYIDWTQTLGGIPAIASFGEDAKGELYIVSLFGSVHRITQAPWYLWRNRNFSPEELADPSVSGPSALGGDGKPHLLRFALGLDRQEALPSDFIRTTLLDDNGSTRLAFSIDRDPGAGGLSWIIQNASDLGDSASWSASQHQIDEDTPARLSGTDLIPITPENPRFLRLLLELLD